jgi:polysaccharide biosynthesis protein PslH
MKILWVKANKILPVHSGGDLRSFNILRQLARHHQVTFLSYYDGPWDADYETNLQRELPGAVCVSTGQQQGSVVARGFDYLRRLPNAVPYAVSRFASGTVQATLNHCLSERPDVAVCDFLDAAINFPQHAQIPSVLFQHNVESEIWRRNASNGLSGVKKLVYRMEFRKMLGYEQQALARFDHVIAVSDHDKKLMSAWTEPQRISVVPTGVDTEQFCPDNSVRQKPLVIFVGAMDWEPNVDAVKYFCAEIWPSVVAEVPQARFRIVGRNPDRRVKALKSSSIEVTGRVPSVVDHLREAAVVVVPLRVGGGTRIKIYEAMATAKAVVSTTVGAEGLDVHQGQDIVLSDKPKEFAESVVRLMKDEQARVRLGNAAAALVSYYGWPVIAAKFAEILESVTRQGSNLLLHHQTRSERNFSGSPQTS